MNPSIGSGSNGAAVAAGSAAVRSMTKVRVPVVVVPRLKAMRVPSGEYVGSWSKAAPPTSTFAGAKLAIERVKRSKFVAVMRRRKATVSSIGEKIASLSSASPKVNCSGTAAGSVRSRLKRFPPVELLLSLVQ